MQIFGENPLQPLRPLAGREPARTRESPPSRSRVEVSERARELARLSLMARRAPEVRHHKVEALRRQIEAGEYEVDLERLADYLSRIL